MQWTSGLALQLMPIVRIAPSNDHESMLFQVPALGFSVLP